VTKDSVALADLDTEAHVWLARPDDIQNSRKQGDALSLLSPAERDRHARFRFEIHRKLFLVAHSLVRTSLSRYADLSPSEWQFSKCEFGRPEITRSDGAPLLRFNLSHTDGLAACVICLDIDCGVDVERMNRVRDLHGVARRVFTPTELEDLRGRDGESLEGRFTDYWTLKEAYMKARGMGFQLPPRSFTVQLDDCDEIAPRLELPADFDDRSDDWQLSLYPLSRGQDPGYRLAVALRTGSAGSRRVVVREAV
jgi:4'-phosphopantetheinyl transferase